MISHNLIMPLENMLGLCSAVAASKAKEAAATSLVLVWPSRPGFSSKDTLAGPSAFSS